MTLDDSQRRMIIQHKLEKAMNTIHDVRFLIDNGKFIFAMNRLYYAIFYAISALALQHGFSTTKHKQLLGWFNKNFVKEGKIDRKFGEVMYIAFDKRSKGDYDDFAQFTKEETEELFEDVNAFIHALEHLITPEKA